MPGKGDKTRIIVSQRLISPLSCCNNFNSKAIQFRSSITKSLSLSRLNADIAVKAAMGKKPTYEDTDNKKREFTGTTKPGVTEIAPGIRVEENQAWEEGRSLVLYPSWKSKRAMNLDANFGWIKDVPDTNFETAQNIRKSKPQLKFTKYNVSRKTGDVIPESETEIDMAYPSLGLSRAQRLRRDRNASNSKIEFKGLPGRSLESRIPGGNLLARTAGRLGIARDANNKFRCPPGTPAANQFTDHLGTNCFGVSAERAAKFIADKISDLMRVNDSESLSLASGAKNTWRERISSLRGGGLPGRNPSYDGSTGDRIPTPDARIIDVPGRMRWFKNATVNAQDKLRRSNNTVNKLSERLGISGATADQIAINDDRWMAFEQLSKLGLWDVEITGRLTEDQVNELVLARLQNNPEYFQMGQRERDVLLAADKKRYYETERAFLDTALEQFALRPEHMRTVGKISFVNNRLPDGSEADTQWVPDSKGIDIRSQIRIHLPTILDNQEELIPNMGPYERLVISAVGATTDAAASAEIADFLVNTEYTARGMAGLIDGPRSFARHIMLHEIGHTIQGEAFLTAVKKQLDATGSIKVPIVKGGKLTKDLKEVTDFKKLTGTDLAALVIGSQDDINVAALTESMSRIENVAFLAGSYPNQYKTPDKMETYALEATAELFALREEGIIFGDDIDDALSWMDDAIGETTAEARAISDAEIFEKLEESYFSPYDKGEDVLPIRKHLRAPVELDRKAINAKKEKKRMAEFDKKLKELNQNQLAEALAITMEDIDVNISQLNQLRAERKSIESSDLPDAEKTKALADIDASITEGEEILKELKKIESLAVNANKTFNTNGKRESDSEIRKMAKDILDKRPPATPEELERRVRKARMDSLKAEAAVLDDKALVRRMADLDLAAASAKPGSDEFVQSIADREIFFRQYMENKRASGDVRPDREIKKELKAEITKVTTEARDAVDAAKRGKIKPQKMKSKADIASNAKKERAKHRRNITKEQFGAVKEIDDFNTAQITQILDPNKQVVVGRAINKKNARLKRLGLEIDPASVDEGSFDEQIENILIPAMESIDASSISTPFEMEIFIDSSKTTRIKPGREIELDTFGQGKVLSRSMKPGKPQKGEKKKRVVVRMKEGDRGIFPLAQKGEDQDFVIPPGKLRVVGRDKDGSLIVEIASQKDTTDVLDDLSRSIGDGPGDAIWRKGAKRKIQSIADRHAIKRKDDSPGTKSDDAAKITETSESILTEVAESGSEFGETSSELISETRDIKTPEFERRYGRFGQDLSEPDPYSNPELFIGTPEFNEAQKIRNSNGTPPTLSSGARESTESLRTKRQERFKSVLGDVNSRPEPLLSSMSALKQENEILYRRVDDILNTESVEQITERIEDAALKLHSGFDRRVRVRMKENDIDDLSRSNKVRALSLSSGAVNTDSETRRARRATRSFGSFRLKDEQKKTAKGAKDEFKKLKDSNLGNGGLDKLSDEVLKRDHGLERSTQKSVLSENPIYKTDSAEQAIALLALGYEVEVSDTGERKMVKNAALQTTEELQNVAEDEADLLNLTGSERSKYIKNFMETHDIDLCGLYEPTKNVFCNENIGVKRENMPQSSGPVKSSDSPAMMALIGGHVEGEYVDVFSMSKKDRDKLKEIRKKLKTPGAEVSEEDRQFAALHEDTVGRYSDISKILGSGDPEKVANVSDDDKNFVFENTNWAKVEPKTEPQLIEFLKKVLPGGKESILRKSKEPDELFASQKQLRNSQIDSQAEGMLLSYQGAAAQWKKDGLKVGTPEFDEARKEWLSKQWFQGAILTSRDGYVVDGHHRWAAIKMLNDHMGDVDGDEHPKIEVQVNEIQTSIFESLVLAKTFQEHLGIKGKTVGVDPFPYQAGEVKRMSKAEFDEHLQYLEKNIRDLAQKIKEDGLYPVEISGLSPATPDEDLAGGIGGPNRTRKLNNDLTLSSGATTRRDKINKRGLIDKFILEKNKTGDEARGFEFDSSSINKPTKIDKDEFFKIVGEVPGVSDSDELLKTEKLTSSRVQGLKIFRGTYSGKNGEKNRVFGRYTTPDGREYTISNDEDGFEGMYYAYQGDKRLNELERVGKLTLLLNDNKLNVHDLFNIDVNEDDRKSGLAQAMVEVAKADFPDATFTTRRVVTDEGAQFARNISKSRTVGKNNEKLTLSSGAESRRDVKRGLSQYELPTYEQLSDKQKEKVRKTAARVQTEKRDDLYYEMMKDKFNFPPMEYVPEYDELTPKQKEEVRRTAARVQTEKRDDVYYEMMKDKFDFKLVKRKRKESELSLASGAQSNSGTIRSVGKNKNKKEGSKKEEKPDWFAQFGNQSKDAGSESVGNRGDVVQERLRAYYESVGLGPNVKDELLPVSGYLVHKSHIQKKKNSVIESRSGNVGPDAIFEIEDDDIVGSGLAALGDIEVVLKPEVSKRTAYGRGSGVRNGHRPVMMNSKSKDDIAHALSFTSRGDAENETADSIVNLLASSIDGDFSRTSKNNKTKSFDGFEAHILGGFDKDEIDSLNYPYSKLTKISKNEDISDVVNDKSIADSLRKMGFTQKEIDYFYSVGGSGQINTASMAKLREYRAAKKIKSKYSKLGFDKVNIAHPQGLNIENPRSHSKASRGIEDVETLLKSEIAEEISQMAKELLKEMRKNSKPSIVSKIGSGI